MKFNIMTTLCEFDIIKKQKIPFQKNGTEFSSKLIIY